MACSQTYTSESLGKQASGNPLTVNVHIADNPPVRSKSRREEVIEMARTKAEEKPRRGRPPKARPEAEKPRKARKAKAPSRATGKAK